MLFTTDKQTIEDLNIFGKHGSDSLYATYNLCATRGGAKIMQEMFSHPLSDDGAINIRSGIIQYFALASTVFPFSAADFDAIEPYLNNIDDRTRLSEQDYSIRKRLSTLIAVNVDIALIHKGITAVFTILNVLHNFIRTLGLNDNDFYKVDATTINELLQESAFDPVLNQKNKNKLSDSILAQYDLIFRFRHRDTVQKLLRHIYYLDVYLSVARVTQERKFTFPKALPKYRHTMILKGVYHSQVKNAVANSIDITTQSNVIFLTGANMAGKSTFMKSISAALYLAHMGFPVAAAKMEFSVMDGIYTTINLPDDLGMGASHFYAEVLRVKKIANELAQGKNLYVVFDELFRGTNVKDAYEATIALTGAFASRKNSMFVISTHIMEAGEALRKQFDNVRFVYLPTKMEGTKPIYTYTLEEGITDDRHGMVIINNAGILDILEAGLSKII